MTTKEKILEAALYLFNNEGTDKITTRHIAAHVKISHGNLTYHYPKKEDIIIKLYKNLVEELDREFQKLQHQDFSLETLFLSTRITFSTQYKYKFILMEMVSIMRRINFIKLHFQALFERRKEQFTFIISLLIDKKLLKKELFPGQYASLIRQFYIVGDFWLSEAEILYNIEEKSKISLFVRTANDMILPYLTETGWNEIKKLYEDQN